MPLIFPSNTLSAAGFSVDNSCRFNDGDSPKMVKSSTAGNRTNWTFSAWFKRSGLGASQDIMASSDGSNNYCYLQINSDDKMRFLDYSSGNNCNKITNRLFRDPSAWMNVVLAIDTTDGTAEDRFKLYINGVRETSFATSANFSSSFATNMNVSGHSNAIGTNQSFNGQYFDGYLAEIVLVDGTTLAPTDNIGKFDDDSPTIWKPIDVSGLTFGNNGFYLDFEASDNLGNDANGGTDLTETNLDATDQATDTSTNNFAVMNNLIPDVSNITYSEGNLLITQSTGAWVKATSTFGMSAGKWYWEAKWVTDGSGTGSWLIVGVDNNTTASTTSGYTSTSVGWKRNGDLSVGGVAQSAISAYVQDDILSVALDMDNDAVYFAKNGTWENSGDPTSGATKTGAYTLPVANSTYFATISPYDTSVAGMNFGGCPSFAISSSNADADGYGNMEYAVPSGYYTLCSKNLGAYGG